MAFPAPICVPSGNAPQQDLRSPRLKSPERRVHTSDTKYEKNAQHKPRKMSRARMFLDMAREGYIDNPCIPKRIYGSCEVHRVIK